MTKEAGTKIDNCMKVMKFGGTSVGSVNSILSVKQIVEAVEEPVIVVVSALGGITDKLINTSQMADNSCNMIFQPLLQYFRSNIITVLIDRKSTRLNSSHLTGSRMPSSA